MKLFVLTWSIWAFGLIGLSAADSLPKLAGTAILTIGGNIKHTNSDNGAQFDREMLESLGTDVIVTSTPWFEGDSKFEGVRLDKLLALVGAKGETVTAIALNDYVTTIPFDDFSKHDVLLALKRNGEYMSVRGKGPLFIIYPFDSKSELKSQTYYSRSAWQLAKLVIE